MLFALISSRTNGHQRLRSERPWSHYKRFSAPLNLMIPKMQSSRKCSRMTCRSLTEKQRSGPKTTRVKLLLMTRSSIWLRWASLQSSVAKHSNALMETRLSPSTTCFNEWETGMDKSSKFKGGNGNGTQLRWTEVERISGRIWQTNSTRLQVLPFVKHQRKAQRATSHNIDQLNSIVITIGQMDLSVDVFSYS